MRIKELRRIRLSSGFAPPSQEALPWLWSGFLLPGDITLLTSQWKTGKTTLLAGLLQSLGTGAPFLNRPTRPARAWIVSEESESQWAERLRLMPLGPHVELLARPFPGRPTLDEWNFLIDQAIDASVAEKLELVVIDPLASFLPGRCESDAGTLLEALQPLHRLTTAGVAVLLLHHPRKKSAEVGSSARGSGALLGFVDCSVELTRYSKLKTDFQRRLLSAQSRRRETPARLAYEWNPQNGAFADIVDPRHRQLEENWQTILAILEGRTSGITAKEIATVWPDDTAKPSQSSLYDWLNLATTRKLVRREGSGSSRSPWLYRLKNEDDEYRDRGELPPLKDLKW